MRTDAMNAITEKLITGLEPGHLYTFCDRMDDMMYLGLSYSYIDSTSADAYYYYRKSPVIKPVWEIFVVFYNVVKTTLFYTSPENLHKIMHHHVNESLIGNYEQYMQAARKNYGNLVSYDEFKALKLVKFEVTDAEILDEDNEPYSSVFAISDDGSCIKLFTRIHAAGSDNLIKYRLLLVKELTDHVYLSEYYGPAFPLASMQSDQLKSAFPGFRFFRTYDRDGMIANLSAVDTMGNSHLINIRL